MLNIDDFTAIFQLSFNILLFVGLSLYVWCTHTWGFEEEQNNFGDDHGNETLVRKERRAGVGFDENSDVDENMTRLDSTLKNTSNGYLHRNQPLFDVELSAINSKDNISRKELSSIFLKRNPSKRSTMGFSNMDTTAHEILAGCHKDNDDGFVKP